MIALTILIFAVLEFAVLKTTFSYLDNIKKQRDDEENINEDENDDKDEELW